MDRDTVERCAKAAERFDPFFNCDQRGMQDPETGEVSCAISDDGCECAIAMDAAERIAANIRSIATRTLPPVDGELVEAQIDRLATFIMENIDGEPSQSEGAVDCAIRLLSHPTDARKVIEDCVEAFINLEANPFERGVWIDVNNALTAAQDYLGEK